MEHGLCSTEHLATDRTGASTHPVLLLQVPVESLHEGCPLITNVTSPGFVVLVVSVHVVHQPSEPPALFVAELADAEGLDTRGDFLLGLLAHLAGFCFRADPGDGSPPPPHPWRWRAGDGGLLAAAWSTLIGQGMSRLCSHWLDLDQSVATPALLCHKDTAQGSL